MLIQDIEKNGVITVKARAKLNLALEITGVRPDGYHLIESLMVPVDLHDTLEICICPVKSPDSAEMPTIEIDRPDIPVNSDNTVWKSWRHVERLFGTSLRGFVKINKRIPACAGLGGGSADAGAFLRCISGILGVSRTDHRWQKAALLTGCDVPFCFQDIPAIVGDTGGVVTPVEWHETSRWIVLVQPEVRASTPEVYAEYDRNPQSYQDAVRNYFRSGRCYNALEQAAARCCPGIATALKDLRTTIGNACMTGSGSACFSICSDEETARKWAARLSDGYPFARAVSIPGPP